MSDELTPQAGGEQPGDEQASSANDEVAKLRREAANWRTKFRDLEGKWKEAEPVLTQFQQQQEAQKSEAQKALERAQAAERQAEENLKAAARAQREAKAVKLAAKANVDIDLLELVDLDKLDLDNEDEALKKLSRLAAARQTANSASNPGRGGASGPSDAELRDIYFNRGGRSKTTIFGGN